MDAPVEYAPNYASLPACGPRPRACSDMHMYAARAAGAYVQCDVQLASQSAGCVPRGRGISVHLQV